MEIPEPQHRLTDDRDLLRALPAAPGVYAAWLTDQGAMIQAGLAPAERHLIYVGKAGGRYGLRQRLRLHARVPWYSLLHALAAGRHVLPCWWVHARKTGPHKRVVHPSGLAQVATGEALAWQSKYISWGYEAVANDRLTAHEKALIGVHRPLINLAGQGYGARTPLIRNDGFPEQVRAWWLYRAAWLAVITGQPDGYVRRQRGARASRIEVGWDDAGWPTTLASATEHATVDLHPEARQRQRLIAASPSHLHEAARRWADADEASAWTYALTGLALTNGVDTADVLADAMSRGRRYEGPQSLPAPSSREALHRLVSGRGRLIPDVVH